MLTFDKRSKRTVTFNITDSLIVSKGLLPTQRFLTFSVYSFPLRPITMFEFPSWYF